MSKSNEELFAAMQSRKEESSRRAEVELAEQQRIYAAERAAQEKFDQAVAHAGRLIGSEITSVNKRLASLDAELIFGETDRLSGGGQTHWLISFGIMSQNLKRRMKAELFRHSDGGLQVRYRDNDGSIVQGDLHFRFGDLQPEDAHTIVNRLLNHAIGD